MIYSGMFFRADDDDAPNQYDVALSPRSTFIAGAIVLLIALWIRGWNIAAGLPDLFEEATPFLKARAIWNPGGPGLDFNPHFFNYPAFTIYLHWIVQACHYAFGRVFGLYPDFAAFQQSLNDDITRHVILARLVDVAFDLGTIAIVMAFGRRFIGKAFSLVAGVILAISPLHVDLARQVNVDVPMVFFSVAAIYALVLYGESGKTRLAFVSGVLIGMAAACKYTALVLIPVMIAVYLWRIWGLHKAGAELPVKDLVVALLAVETVFLLVNPFVLLDVRTFRRDFAFESTHVSTGHFGIAQGSSSTDFYLLQTLPEALGWIGLAFAVYGIIDGVIRRRKEGVPIMLVLVGFALPLGASSMHADRYFLPLVAPLAICAAGGMRSAAWTVRSLSGLLWQKWFLPALLAALTFGIIVQPASALLLSMRESAKTDTRVAARVWLAGNLPDRSVVAMAPFGLTLTGNRIPFQLPYMPLAMEAVAPFYDARWYVDFDAVIGSDFDRVRFYAEPERYAAFIRNFYQPLESSWRREASFAAGQDLQGPHIWIYRSDAYRAQTLYPDELVSRLDSVASQRMLVGFCLNMASILDWKGMHEKANQIWDAGVACVLARDNPRQSMDELSELPVKAQRMPRFAGLASMLRDSILVRTHPQ